MTLSIFVSAIAETFCNPIKFIMIFDKVEHTNNPVKIISFEDIRKKFEVTFLTM